MAERDELSCVLGSHYSFYTSNADHISFTSASMRRGRGRRVWFYYSFEGTGGERYGARGSGFSQGMLLGAHIHHAGIAMAINMGWSVGEVLRIRVSTYAVDMAISRGGFNLILCHNPAVSILINKQKYILTNIFTATKNFKKS